MTKARETREAATPIEGPTLSHWQRKIELQKWAVLGGRFGKLATCYWVSAGYVPRFTPPEGSFVNFLAQMANTVLRYRGGKFVPPAQPAPAARIALPIRNTRAIEISTVLCHDLRWVPTRLAQKIYAGARSKGCYRRENFVPPAVTTSPIDRPFDRRGRHSSRDRVPTHSCLNHSKHTQSAL